MYYINDIINIVYIRKLYINYWPTNNSRPKSYSLSMVVDNKYVTAYILNQIISESIT